MNIIAFEIVELALSLLKVLTSGKTQQDVALGEIILQIVQKALRVYQENTGKALDPSLIKAEAPL